MSLRLQTRPFRLAILLLLLSLSAIVAPAQTTSFTYQGRLSDGGTPANGNYDLQFTLWDSNSGGTQIGSTQNVPTVAVSGGIFTVQLDFGANAFPGANRFLEIGTRLSGAASFTTLAPRQQISSTPYAIRSLNASSADAVTVTGVPSGSGNYIQNTTTSQAGANFNLSGNGTAGGTLSANVVNAIMQYNLNGVRWLAAPFGDNVLIGNSAGGSLVSGGFTNVFIGNLAGFHDSVGYGNSFIGTQAGVDNYTGYKNTIVGFTANVGAPDLTNATAIGANARVDQSNSLVLGSVFGFNDNFAPSVNVGIGTTTPQNTLHVKGGVTVETSGSGGNIGFGTPNSETGMTITKGTTSRFDMRFDGSVLKLVANAGNPVAIPPPTNGVAITTAGNVGIGTISPAHRLSVIGGPSWTTSFWNGSMEFGNASAIGWQANSGGWHFGIGQTNGGLYFFQTSSALGSTLSPATYDMVLTDGGNVGIGTINPATKLDIVGGFLRLDQVMSGGDPDQICRDTITHNISFCSSSLRYKKDVTRFTGGLDIINRLRPIAFTWKQGGTRDVGLAAEEVEKVEPLLTFRNDKGEVEGIRYNRLPAVLINAIKEQQDQIERQQAEARQQQEQIARQQLQIEQLQQQQKLIKLQEGREARQQQQIAILTRLVCLNHPRARICKPGD